jgi:hypothetical protein
MCSIATDCGLSSLYQGLSFLHECCGDSLTRTPLPRSAGGVKSKDVDAIIRSANHAKPSVATVNVSSGVEMIPGRVNLTNTFIHCLKEDDNFFKGEFVPLMLRNMQQICGLIRQGHTGPRRFEICYSQRTLNQAPESEYSTNSLAIGMPFRVCRNVLGYAIGNGFIEYKNHSCNKWRVR